MMKKVLFFVALVFLFHQNINAQEDFCYSATSSANDEFNQIISKKVTEGALKLPPVTLRVYFHVFRRTNGTGGYLPNEVPPMLDILQTDYNPHGIFFAWDGCIDYIDNDARHNNSVSFFDNSMYSINNHDDGIDIYVYPASNGTAGGKAFGVGENSAFWISGTWQGNEVPSTSIISHEMGHVIFLWHTHHGCETGDWENTNGSDCAFMGDFVCDTPSDPHLGFNVDANCNWTGVPQCSPPEPIGNYNPDPNIIMAYTDPECMAYFTPGQGQRMQFAISLMPYLQACIDNTTTTDACECPAVDIVIDEDVVIDQDMVVTGNINLIDGAQMTVLATIFFTEDHGINMFEDARLLVNGGILTSCDATWRGVKVSGGNTNWDVRIINNSLVENTSEAAVSMVAPVNPMNFGNGILIAENSTFDNTFMLAEFMAWSPSPNLSRIENCTQNGGTFCVDNWNCQFIQIRDNEFNNITASCITTETGSFTIVGNKFSSQNNDILFNNVSAGISTLVEKNSFNSSFAGYRANGTTFAQNQIYNNLFDANIVDVWNQGHNSYELADNDSEAFIGAFGDNNGAGIADIHNNDFSTNFLGLYCLGTDDDLNFFENCFNSTWADVYISGNVSPVIHNDVNLAAENCYTHQGNPGSTIPDITGSPAPVIYLEEMGKVDDCANAILAVPTVNRWNWATGGVNPCGAEEADDEIYELCFPKRNIEDVKQAYYALIEKINEIENDNTITDEEREILLAQYRKCLERVKGMYAELFIKDGKYNNARELYSNDKTDDSKVFVYSTYLLQNKLEAANVYLDSYESATVKMKDFKLVQRVNLRRLPFGPFFEPTEEELDLIYEIGMKDHPYAAYARALYFNLKRKMIKSEIPDFDQDPKKSSLIQIRDEKEAEFIISPNPFSDELNIAVENIEGATIKIFNNLGLSVHAINQVSSDQQVNTSHWSSGMYIVYIEKDGVVLHQKKLILVK